MNYKNHKPVIFDYFIIVIFLLWVEQLLWNYCLVPSINGINKVSYFQIIGIDFLIGLLFGSGYKKMINKKD
jgi:hypothetical protein